MPASRIRAAHILVILGDGEGACDGSLAGEIVKNVALQGVGAVTILTGGASDGAHRRFPAIFPVEARDGGPADAIAALVEGASLLNASVHIRHDVLGEVADAMAAIASASIVILLGGMALADAVAINCQCRQAGTPFEWIQGGSTALLINDFGSAYAYVEERKSIVDGQAVTTSREETLSFPSLEDVWRANLARCMHDEQSSSGNKRRITKAVPQPFSHLLAEHQRHIEASGLLSRTKDGGTGPEGATSCAFAAPVAAIIGAVASQEAIKAITGRDRPIHNVVLFDGRRMDSAILSIAAV